MNNWRFVTLAVAIFAGSAATVAAAPLQVIDQQNRVAAPGNFFTGESNFGQSFVPSLDRIDAIEFDLGALAGGSTVFVNLRDGLVGEEGLEGPILGTTETLVLSAGAPIETRHFDFPETVPLTPGNTYVAEIVGFSGHAGAHTFRDDYAPGQALKIFQPNVDLLFATGLHVPEPATTALLAAAFGWPMLFTRRRRPQRHD